MWYHLRSTGCSRSGIAHPALPNRAWDFNIVIYPLAPEHGKGNSAQPCRHKMLSPEGSEENRIRKIPSGKMLLERVGLTPCQGDVSNPSSRRSDYNLRVSP